MAGAKPIPQIANCDVEGRFAAEVYQPLFDRVHQDASFANNDDLAFLWGEHAQYLRLARRCEKGIDNHLDRITKLNIAAHELVNKVCWDRARRLNYAETMSHISSEFQAYDIALAGLDLQTMEARQDLAKPRVAWGVGVAGATSLLLGGTLLAAVMVAPIVPALATLASIGLSTKVALGGLGVVLLGLGLVGIAVTDRIRVDAYNVEIPTVQSVKQYLEGQKS